MKKLNITKEQFEKSKYFKNKYGTLEYVSESGRVFKTSKGKLLKFKESTKKFCRKFKESVGDVARDPAYVCPYCGGRNCEFVDAEDYPQDGYFDGAELLSCFKCNDCDKNYSVVFKLSVDDVVNADPGRFNDDECPPGGYYGPKH